MKVAFWSNVHGQTGTTSNLIAIAVMSALQYQVKNFLTHSHFNLNNLETPFLTISETDKKEYFMNVGIDALTRTIKSSYLDSQIIENCTLSFMNKQLMLLPGTVKGNRKLFEEDIGQTIAGILRVADRYHDCVFIDTNPGYNPLTMKILNAADLIVVNLNQNLSILNYYDRNELFQKKKVFYLFGNYTPNSRYSLTNLKKHYSWLKGKNAAVIPYNTEFMDAQSDGKIIPFFKNNINCDREDPNSYFIGELKKAVDKLMVFAGVERRKKEWIT